MAKSPRLSFKGYKFSEALLRNKDEIKAAIMVLGAFSTYLGATGSFNWYGFLISLLVAFGALTAKLLADAVDFFTGEIEI